MSPFNQSGDSSGWVFCRMSGVCDVPLPFVSNQQEISVVSFSFRHPDNIFD